MTIERCQFENSLYSYRFGLRFVRALLKLVRRYVPRKRRNRIGAPSRFAVGDVVRVRDAAAIRATLDSAGALRGLRFVAAQWACCGGVFEVETVVRRMMNDAGVMVPISGTVALKSVTCDASDARGGCGRSCPLLFRDEWLEAAERGTPSTAPSPSVWARVRSREELLRSVNRSGVHEGLMLMPEMLRYAGMRLPVRKVAETGTERVWRRRRGDWYILEGARCSGTVLGSLAPCDRGCALLWHPDWLTLERQAGP